MQYTKPELVQRRLYEGLLVGHTVTSFEIITQRPYHAYVYSEQCLLTYFLPPFLQQELERKLVFNRELNIQYNIKMLEIALCDTKAYIK
jgi:hypothetical protein